MCLTHALHACSQSHIVPLATDYSWLSWLIHADADCCHRFTMLDQNMHAHELNGSCLAHTEQHLWIAVSVLHQL